MKKYRWLIGLGLAVVVGNFCLALGGVMYRMHLNDVAGKKIVRAMSERYPKLTYWCSGSYESPRIVVHVVGTDNSAEQEEIRSFLKLFKAEDLPEFEVWLRFDDYSLIDYSDTSNRL
jgi:hypothetical protein